MEMLRRPRQPHGRYLFLARMVRVSHETIHLSLFVESRGALRRELQRWHPSGTRGGVALTPFLDLRPRVRLGG
jgi:hypothetical protein